MTPEKALQYDKKLSLKKHLDGSKILMRESPFNAQRSFDIKEFTNIYLGSGRWLRDSLIVMDTQRQNIFKKTVDNNLRIKRSRNQNNMSKNIADMFESGGDIFIN